MDLRTSKAGGATDRRTTPKQAFETVEAQNPELVCSEDSRKRSIVANIYKTITVGNKSQVDLFKSSDARVVGISNLNKGALEKGEPFVVTGMTVLGAVDAGGVTEANIAGATYTELPVAFRTGHVNIKQGDNTFVDWYSLNEFVTGGDSTRPDGYVELPPFVLKTQKFIDIEFEWYSALDPNLSLRVILHGGTKA